MLTRLRLENFKSFKEAELTLGPLTLLVGTNASGKSNLRDAFRFLHGIWRGYSLADIIGGKYGEGGERVWSGIRGGPREIAYQGASRFALEASGLSRRWGPPEQTYRIEVEVEDARGTPSVASESLRDSDDYIYKSLPSNELPEQLDGNIMTLKVKYARGAVGKLSFTDQKPILMQIPEFKVPYAIAALGSMQFLDLDPDAMRRPSLPGQNILGDRGENLSSVLLAICADSNLKQALISWIQALTPMDAANLEFPTDFSGKVLVHLLERDGRKTSANSASDGTLRFLGMLAAFFQPDPIGAFFIDELDVGIHPTRLHLLLQLIEQQVKQGNTQVVATTHSPLLLHLLSPEMREYAHLTYRLEGQPDTRIKRILDIPDASRVIEEYGLGRLLESGWLENAMEFDEPVEEVA